MAAAAVATAAIVSKKRRREDDLPVYPCTRRTISCPTQENPWSSVLVQEEDLNMGNQIDVLVKRLDNSYEWLYGTIVRRQEGRIKIHLPSLNTNGESGLVKADEWYETTSKYIAPFNTYSQIPLL